MARVFEIAFNLAARLGSGFGSAFGSASGQMRNLQTNATRLRGSLRELDASQRAGRISASEYANQQRRLAAELARTERAQRSLSRATALQNGASNARQAAGSTATGAAGAAVVIAAPVMVGANFEQSMADVHAITNATDADFQAMTNSARELGRKTQFSASEAAGGMKFLGMAGFKTNQILSAMPGMLDLATAGNLELATAADISSNILSGFSLKAEQMGRVSDVLAKTFTTSNTNLTQLGEAMKYVAPVASAVGVSIEQTAAMVGLLGNVGIQGSMAGTALRASMIRLVKPPKMARATLASLGEGIDEETRAALEAAEGMDALGMSVEDSQGNMRPMPDLLKEIALKTKDMGNAQRGAAIAAIFGIEASAGMIEIIKQAGSGELDKYINVLENSNGAAKEMARIMLDTTIGAFKIFKSAVEDVSITISNIMLPVVTDLLNKASETANGINAWTMEYPKLTKWLVTGAAAVTGLVLVVSGLAYVLLTIIAPFLAFYTFAIKVGLAARIAAASTTALTLAQRLLSGAMGIARIVASIGMMIAYAAWAGICATASAAWTAAQWLWNAALTANPIGLVIMGIAALIGIGYLLITNWDTVKTWFSLLWNDPMAALTSFANGIMEKLSGPLRWLEEKWINLGSLLAGGIGGVSISSVEGNDLPGHATGGIFNREHIARFAEGGKPEAAIPLDGSSRALSLWSQAGSILGVRPGSSGSIVQIDYKPANIYVYGNPEPGQIQNEVNKASSSFLDFLHNERRLSFNDG